MTYNIVLIDLDPETIKLVEEVIGTPKYVADRKHVVEVEDPLITYRTMYENDLLSYQTGTHVSKGMYTVVITNDGDVTTYGATKDLDKATQLYKQACYINPDVMVELVDDQYNIYYNQEVLE